MSNDTLNDLEKEIVKYLKQNNVINSVKEISSYLEKSESTLKRTIARLLEKNIIIRVGSKKVGYWKLND